MHGTAVKITYVTIKIMK